MTIYNNDFECKIYKNENAIWIDAALIATNEKFKYIVFDENSLCSILIYVCGFENDNDVMDEIISKIF